MSIATFPLWVPALFVGLVAVGLRQARARQVRPGVPVAVGAGLLALSLGGVLSGFPGQAGAVAAWLAGVALALTLAPRWVAARVLGSADGRVTVAGSWWPLGLMMAIFATRFVMGALQGTGSPWAQDGAFAVPASALLGACSGAFAARALGVWRATA